MAKKKGTILIVDDEKDIRSLLCQKLKTEGYRCEEAESADDALHKMKTKSADLVLLDIRMHGKSGVELLPEIKNSYPDTAVIMATVVTDINTAIQCMKQGAYDYLSKPFNLDEVVFSVKRGLEKRRLELENRDYQQRLEQQLRQQAKENRQLFLGAMQSLVFTVEARDSYTAGHSRRVTEIAVAIGKKLGLSDEEQENLYWGSLLHDIGKIAVNPVIVNKPGKLTAAEYEHIMTHPMISASIMQPVVRSEEMTQIIEHHHDHYDGGGLNQKVKGNDIPLLARIVSLADAYDAMTSSRPYRAALPREQVLAEIIRETGKQFDPLVANVFVEMPESDITPVKKKILIADDEPSVRLLLKSVLSSDYAVLEASDGQEAVEATRKHKPALVVLDIFMPNKDGVQACYEIKADSATKEIPVIMLTAIDHELNKKLCAEMGAEQYITKPFKPRELRDVIAKLLKVKS